MIIDLERPPSNSRTFLFQISKIAGRLPVHTSHSARLRW